MYVTKPIHETFTRATTVVSWNRTPTVWNAVRVCVRIKVCLCWETPQQGQCATGALTQACWQKNVTLIKMGNQNKKTASLRWGCVCYINKKRRGEGRIVLKGIQCYWILRQTTKRETDKWKANLVNHMEWQGTIIIKPIFFYNGGWLLWITALLSVQPISAMFTCLPISPLLERVLSTAAVLKLCHNKTVLMLECTHNGNDEFPFAKTWTGISEVKWRLIVNSKV